MQDTTKHLYRVAILALLTANLIALLVLIEDVSTRHHSIPSSENLIDWSRIAPIHVKIDR